MAKQYGLTAQGFVAKQQSEIKAELEVALQAAFGQSLNLLPESVFGQLVGIFSEREALLWQLAEAVYDSQYPTGAEGTSVDNILALNNLRRNPASPSKTDPTPVTQDDDTTLYGLVLRGTPGTVIPAGSTILTNLVPPSTWTLDEDVTIDAAEDDVQTMFFSNDPDTGAFSIRPGGGTVATPDINCLALASSAKVLWLSAAPTSGQFKITLTKLSGSVSTGFLNWNDSTPVIEAAIQALSGYSGVTVVGSIAAQGIAIEFGSSIENPIVTLTSNTLDQTETVYDSVAGSINSISGYQGVRVTGTYATGFVMTGSGAIAGTPIGLAEVDTTTLQNGSEVTNIRIDHTTEGHVAQGIGAATCSENGPTPALAGSLNVIGTPISGWTSVTNQLDVIPGENQETDTEALARRTELLAAQANGPIQAIVEKVQKLDGVSAVVGFENLNISALQKITFSAVPDAGVFQLIVGGSTTANINYNDTASQVQTKIRALTGYEDVLVTGNFTDGFIIDFDASGASETQNLIVVTGSTLTESSNPVTTTVAFNRPGKSFEIIVQGGDDDEIAQTIYESKPAGIQSYGSTTVNVEDDFGNLYPISFSRPEEVTVYVDIVLETDLDENVPEFNPASVETIKTDIVTIGGEVSIGGLIVGFGSDGLIGAFNEVKGIRSYTLKFGLSSSPTANDNIQLLSGQIPIFESFNVRVSYT